ncbi:hypothetical protein Cni_G26474 [Canna indica]|uniref:eRF1/Pelota-like N-terminal domain-containing protein n=1 Tax=Canna indica TaxID=4628 RepID=A0AAQ3L3V6_9LILI|nr:hypothetical protein Cni_G26474 [Canna indica]
MKLVRRDLARGGFGSVKIILEEDDDMWHVYNMISVGDSIQAVTVRKVIRDLAHGGRDTERVKLKLEIKVEQGRLSQAETTMKKLYGKEKIVEVMHGLGAGWSRLLLKRGVVAELASYSGGVGTVMAEVANGLYRCTVDNDLALKIYIKMRATPKVVAAFAERREFDKILIYSKQVLEINLVTYPNVADAILANGTFSHYDRPRIAQLCEKAGLGYVQMESFFSLFIVPQCANWDWFESWHGNQASPIWRNILKLQSNFRSSITYSIGSGTTIKLWIVPWFGSESLALRYDITLEFSEASFGAEKEIVLPHLDAK